MEWTWFWIKNLHVSISVQIKNLKISTNQFNSLTMNYDNNSDDNSAIVCLITVAMYFC